MPEVLQTGSYCGVMMIHVCRFRSHSYLLKTCLAGPAVLGVIGTVHIAQNYLRDVRCQVVSDLFLCNAFLPK